MRNAPVLAISACLTGQRVRFDGGDRLDATLLEWLGQVLDLVRLCPEAQGGLPIPREPMKLSVGGDRVRAVGVRSGRDYAPAILPWCEARAAQFARIDPIGFVLKSNSPSCRGDVTLEGGPASGLFAATVAARLPLVPVADERELGGEEGRVGFASRMFALKRWRDLRRGSESRSGLVAFHTAHKLQLMAHSPRHYQELGRIAAVPGMEGNRPRIERYEEGLVACLSEIPTRGGQVNAMSHAAGSLRGRVPEGELEALTRAVGDYGEGREELGGLLSRLARLAQIAGAHYLARQSYLSPEPAEWRLLISART